jgi:hypothetical protein
MYVKDKQRRAILEEQVVAAAAMELTPAAPAAAARKPRTTGHWPSKFTSLPSSSSPAK